MSQYAAELLADSISDRGVRIVTAKVTFPRFTLAEWNTHRVFSRNSASSRAIPTEILIERVLQDPFVPETFNQRVVGMGVGEEFGEEDAATARQMWLDAAEDAREHAFRLCELGLDKSRANRLLEPFLWHTAIFTSTEWDNFFAQRLHKAAQPEFQIVASALREAIDASQPQVLTEGQWHLPLVEAAELQHLCDVRFSGDPDAVAAAEAHVKKLSASRCARVSYDRFDDEPIEKTIQRAEFLMTNGHFSPFEHVARPFSAGENEVVEDVMRAVNMGKQHIPKQRALDMMHHASFCGNFRGWVQMRYEIPFQRDFGQVLEAQMRARDLVDA